MEQKHGLAHRLYTGQLAFEFIKNRRIWFSIALVLVVLSIGAVAVRGLELGIEFKGGTDFRVEMEVKDGTVAEVRSKVSNIELENLEPQVFSLGSDAIRVQTRSLTPDETTTMRQALAQIAGSEADAVTYSAIGPSWGERISQRAFLALSIFVVAVMFLIWFWFRDWRMSVAALVALAHDVAVTVGVYALVGFTVTPATVIGVLTILGYSLYDTVVVFDKVRENVLTLDEHKLTYSQAANLAINQVLIRSINTTVIGVLPVTGLLVAGSILGSGPLGDLGLALLVGMISGAYSSIFIAAPVLSKLKERDPVEVKRREALEKREARAKTRAQRRSKREEASA